MKNNDAFAMLSSTETGARLLIETIIRDYGVQDFLQCVFYGFNEADQEKFLNAAFQRVGTK